MEAGSRKRVAVSLWIILGLVLVYLLSIGPAYRLMRTGAIQQNTFLNLYAPINNCCEHSKLFERIMDNFYLELWYSDTRNQKRWLEQLGDSQETAVPENPSTNAVPPRGEE